MQATLAKSSSAISALNIVTELQNLFKDGLMSLNTDNQFERAEWFRQQGHFGGGQRYIANNNSFFNRGSINISQVHYDSEPEKSLSSATALSTIIHPKNPLAPSIHIHTSWTELRNGNAYWRIMADLNPAILIEEDKQIFLDALSKLTTPKILATALAQGDKYFHIPVLQRHRGVAHFYLENFFTESPEQDKIFAKDFTAHMINCYLNILRGHQQESAEQSQYQTQLNYHTLYFFQVLTLDRGTTSGLLIHNENDLGIMGSLPAFIDRPLLEQWLNKMPSPQDQLVKSILAVLPSTSPCPIDDAVKINLAQTIRKHYQQYPEALALQASGNTIPGTVDNHR